MSLRFEDISVLGLLVDGFMATFSGAVLVFLPAYMAFLAASLSREKIYEKEGFDGFKDVFVTVASFSSFFAAAFLVAAQLKTPALVSVYGTEHTGLHIAAGLLILLWSLWLFTQPKILPPTVENEGEWPQSAIGAVMVGLGLGLSVHIEMPNLLAVLNLVVEGEMLSHSAGLLFFYMFGLAIGMILLGLGAWSLLKSFHGSSVVFFGALFLVLSALLAGVNFYALIGDSLSDVIPSLGSLG